MNIDLQISPNTVDNDSQLNSLEENSQLDNNAENIESSNDAAVATISSEEFSPNTDTGSASAPEQPFVTTNSQNETTNLPGNDNVISDAVSVDGTQTLLDLVAPPTSIRTQQTMTDNLHHEGREVDKDDAEESNRSDAHTDVSTTVTASTVSASETTSNTVNQPTITSADVENSVVGAIHAPAAVHQQQSHVQFTSSLISSDLSAWTNKSYIGGFRHKATKAEYFHAQTQTITAQEKKAKASAVKYHRDTQTKFYKNRLNQAKEEASTQMDKPGCHISTIGDKYIVPRRYVTADEHEAMVLRKIIAIQCFVRKCFAIRVVRKMRSEKEERRRAVAEKERRRKELAEKKRKKELDSRLHPRTAKDFEILYNGLENWRKQETKKINKSGYSEAARLTALADLLDQESALIQKIDRLKIAANEENRETGVITLLDKMSSPKKWHVNNKKGGVCLVDTPNTIRARELRDLYHALNIPLLSVDERLQILLHVKYTVKEFDCTLTRDIVELIDREGDLVSRGRDAKSLEGLRRRVSNLFLQFIQTPEFNPEAKAYQKFPDAGQSWKRDQAVYYCRGCTKYLPSTDFYLSTTMRHLGRCKTCTMKENIANQRKDDSCYVDMLRFAKSQEAVKRTEDSSVPDNDASTPSNDQLQQQQEEEGMSVASSKNEYSVISLLQESDIRYLVDIIWNRQSAVSGSKKILDLVLTRWDIDQELSPWNIILLTREEAQRHETTANVLELYSEEFTRRVRQRHLATKKHFGSLPYMERYLKENYVDNGEGKFVARDENSTNAKASVASFRESLENEINLSIEGFNIETQ